MPGCFRGNTSLWDDTKWNLKMKYKALLSSAVWPPDENDHKKKRYFISQGWHVIFLIPRPVTNPGTKTQTTTGTKLARLQTYTYVLPDV